MNAVNEQVKFQVVNKEENIVMLSFVRPSYANLWRPGLHKGKRKPNLDTSFLISADQKVVAAELNKFIIGVAQTVSPKIQKMGELEHPKLVKSKDGENYVLKTSNQFNYPPTYINTRGTIIGDPAEGKDYEDKSKSKAELELYSGCYCRIKVQFKPTVDAGITKVWSNLICIQFLAHGERLGGGGDLSDEDKLDGFGAVDVPSDFDKVGSSSADELDDGFDDDLGGLDDGLDDGFGEDDFDLD